MARRLLTLAIIFSALASRANSDSYVAPRPMANDFADAEFVVVGAFVEPPAGPRLNDGTTDFLIEEVVKSDDWLKNSKKMELPRRRVDTDIKYLVFADIHKGKADCFRAVPLPAGSQTLKYFKDTIALQGKPQKERLRFFFDHLNSPDKESAADAHREFGRADYKDYREIAKTFPKERLLAWLNDPATPAYRRGVFGFLLGHSGGHRQKQRRFRTDGWSRQDRPGRRLGFSPRTYA